MGNRTALGLAAILVATLLALTVGSRSEPAGTAASELDPATGRLTFSLETFDGEVLGTEQLRGRPAVLNGYASWCLVCAREMPDFERVHQALGDDLAIVGVNPQSNDTDAAQARLVDNTGVTYPTVRDPQDRLTRLFSPSGGLPVTVFLDADGVVQAVHRGLLTEDSLRERVAEVLGVRG